MKNPYQGDSMKVVAKVLLFTSIMTSASSAFALNKFFCQCQAKAPGYEETNRETGGIDKICSYSCSCVAWEEKKNKKGEFVATQAVPNIKLDLNKLATTATSREEWDHGSHVCHGQYSYKPNMSDANWKIKVKFDTFGLNNDGDVIYAEEARREIAQGVNYVGFKYSKKAREISGAILKQLSERK